MGRQVGGEGQPAVRLPMHWGHALANVYPLPQLMYNTALASVNKQSCAASASDSLAFSAQLLLLLFLINMPELFRHTLLCYLWFVNMMFAGRKHNHNSARAVHTGRKICCKAKEARRLEPQVQAKPHLTCHHTRLEVQKTHPAST